jgi:HAD superfamily hydrolase (TIGR01509 family)
MGAALVIFDCDGVLVDSEPIAALVLSQALIALGLPYDLPRVDRCFRGRSLVDIVTSLEEEQGRPLPSDFVRKLNARTFVAFQKELQPIAGVAEALRLITASGRAVCVASSGTHEKMRLSLGLTGLLPFFGQRLFSASEVARGKPAPDLFEHAAKEMGCTAEESIVIEDSVPGVRAGVAAGARVLGYVSSDLPHGDEHSRALAQSGAETFSSMEQLPGLLGLS